MPYVQRPTSMAEIHAIYGEGKSPDRPTKSSAAYAKASFSTREAHHPGSPPELPPRRSGSKPRSR
jgi:hypothetical protein